MNQLIINLLEEKIELYSNLSRQYCDSYNYYCWDEDIKHELIRMLKSRGEYKKALKEYKKQCEQIWIQKYEKQAKIWREHPDKFIEEFYGTQLLPYQKVFLKGMFKKYLKL